MIRMGFNLQDEYMGESSRKPVIPYPLASDITTLGPSFSVAG